MSGSLRLVDSGIEPAKHDHIDWHISNGKVLRYHDPRRFGALLFVEPNADCSQLSHLGPEPLSDDFNADYLYKLSRKRTQAIKTFIMKIGRASCRERG